MSRSTTRSLLRFRIVERGACVLADRGVLRFRIEDAMKQARIEEFARRTAESSSERAPAAEAA
jgi:hypothetical protein